jgi:hypothetical protein
MGEAKIRLSQKEMEIATSTELILTKNAILQKVNQLLAALQQQQHGSVLYSKEWLPAALTRSSPKISRGENYKGLPYLVLDYPRVFDRENIAAIRTMFWWGNFFSVTLHLSGIYKKNAEQKLMKLWQTLQDRGFYICIQDEQWEHYFEKDNYRPLNEVSKEEQFDLVYNKPFIKLANKVPLTEWDDAPRQLEILFNLVLVLL